jgi:hypothetical protein
MIVDVTWNGVTLAKGAQARSEGSGWFVELEQPMPVGTLLTLEGEAQATVRVARVHEGLGAGMVVTVVGGQRADEKKPDEMAAQAEAAAEEKKEPEGNGNGNGRRDKRRKPKRTVTGH